jgi:hypothetical protein
MICLLPEKGRRRSQKHDRDPMQVLIFTLELFQSVIVFQPPAGAGNVAPCACGNFRRFAFGRREAGRTGLARLPQAGILQIEPVDDARSVRGFPGD